MNNPALDTVFTPGSFVYTVDVFRTVCRSDRIRILMYLKLRRHTVSDLAGMLSDEFSRYHCSRVSAAVSPMHRLGLVNRERINKFVYYDLTDLGREVVRMILAVDQHRKEIISDSEPDE